MVSKTAGTLGSAPGFWAFSVWEMPAFGKRYSELDESELASVNDHWTQLKALARKFLTEYLI